VQRYEWANGSQTDTPYAPSIADHQRIIAAVAAGNALEARVAVEQHWASGVERTNALIARLSGNATLKRRARRGELPNTNPFARTR
jgi:DNA-binding FadR family transcriptional regulator